jgi:hypothetical protein
MAVRSLSVPFDVMGEWYLPAQPEQRVGGTLSYEAEQTELRLNNALLPIVGEIRADTQRRYPVVHGVTAQGEAVTLLDAVQAGFSLNFSSGGVRTPESLLAPLAIFGAYVTSETAYKELRCRIPGLHAWLRNKSIEVSHGEDAMSVSVMNFADETTPVPAIDAELSWRFSAKGTHDVHVLSIAAEGWVTVRPHEPQQSTWFLDQIPKITSLLALLAGPQMPMDQLVLNVGTPHPMYLLLSRLDEKYCNASTGSHFFITRGALGSAFADVVAEWFRLYPTIQYPCSLAMSVMGSADLWSHVEFLSLMQALEGLHRALYNGTYMDPSSYVNVQGALVDAIPKSVSSDHRSSLTSRIRYGNELALAKRVGDLVSGLPQSLRNHIVAHNGKVPRAWIDTRNYYTHWDESLRANLLDAQGMFDASRRMTELLRTLYLQRIGVSQATLEGAFANKSQWSRHLIHLNSVERGREK